ncbi:MAG: hypothetical protein N2442_02235 [Spirochaetes bacterium]|nr:hypothetical protein [Spirochaetota bacterium]
MIHKEVAKVVRKKTAKNLLHRTSRAMVLVLVSFLFVAGLQSITSCDLFRVKSEDSLVGYWKSGYGDGFEIKWDSSSGGYLFKQYDDANKTVSFAGTIENNPDLTASTGYIVIRITDGGTWYKPVGSYYVVHWKDFTGDTVKEASAYKVGGTNNDGMPTAQQALQEYTVENGYFGYYGEYQRQ